jgi:enterochelin esterase-like enzyme
VLTRNSPSKTIYAAVPTLCAHRVHLWFYTGTEDRAFRLQNVLFVRQLDALHVAHTFYVVRGGHNWAIWRGNAARAYLAFSRWLRA